MTMPKPVLQSPCRALVIFKIIIRPRILATDGCFYNDDAIMVCPPPNTGELEELFRY